MNEEDKKIQKHLVDEMMRVYKTNPDVMIYMEALMKKYEELEQKNVELKQQLLSKKISEKDIEYKKRINLQQRIDKAIEYINVQLSQGGPRETRDLVDGYELLNILKGGKND